MTNKKAAGLLQVILPLLFTHPSTISITYPLFLFDSYLNIASHAPFIHDLTVVTAIDAGEQ